MSIVPLPQTCREYLGQGRGNCPRKATTNAADGRMFCREHAEERGEFLRTIVYKGRS